MNGPEFERDATRTMLNDFEDIPCMKPLICRFLMWSGMLLAVTVTPVLAQTPPAPPTVIEVAAVKFTPIRAGAGTWYEAEVEIQAKPGSAADNGNFINRVKVTLNLGVFSAKAAPGAKIPDTYYKASAEAVAVETSGGKTSFRFYLPPEIVKRDKITGDLKFYLVELSLDGRALPLTRFHYPAATFGTTTAIVESFRGKLSAEAGVNDGILLPQYLSPFAFDGSRPAPSFIRVESTR